MGTYSLPNKVMPAHTIGAQSMLRGVAVNTRRKTRADTAGTVQPRSGLKLPVREKPKATTTTKSGSNQWSLKHTIKEKSLGGIGTELSKDVRPGNFSREKLGLEAEGPIFGFTETNELFIGRLAMVAFAGVIVVEAFTGNGVLGQLGVETGLPTGFEEEALFGGAAFFALSAAFPSVLALVNGSAKDE